MRSENWGLRTRRAPVRAGELSAFEVALCEVLRDEMATDGRSIEQIGQRSGVSPNSLRLMVQGLLVSRVDNVHRLAQTLGLPMWAIVKAAEERVESRT